MISSEVARSDRSVSRGREVRHTRRHRCHICHRFVPIVPDDRQRIVSEVTNELIVLLNEVGSTNGQFADNRKRATNKLFPS